MVECHQLSDSNTYGPLPGAFSDVSLYHVGLCRWYDCWHQWPSWQIDKGRCLRCQQTAGGFLTICYINDLYKESLS